MPIKCLHKMFAFLKLWLFSLIGHKGTLEIFFPMIFKSPCPGFCRGGLKGLGWWWGGSRERRGEDGGSGWVWPTCSDIAIAAAF